MTSAVDLEARGMAQRAFVAAEAAKTKAESALTIARHTNDTVLALDGTMKAGFESMGGKIDGLIDDVRASRNSMRPKIASVTEDEKATRENLDKTRAELENVRREHEQVRSELERRVRVQESLEEQRADQAAQIARDRAALKRSARKLAWAAALAFAGAIGAATAAWTVSEARHVAGRAEVKHTQPQEKHE